MATNTTRERDCGYTAQGATLHLVGMPAMGGSNARSRCGRELRETTRAVWMHSGRDTPFMCAACARGDVGVVSP
jgi:hypothetical protein